MAISINHANNAFQRSPNTCTGGCEHSQVQYSTHSWQNSKHKYSTQPSVEYLCSKLRHNKGRFGKKWHRCCKNKVLEQFYALLSVCSSGSRYKSPGVHLKVVIIERKVEVLALLFACGKQGMFGHSLLGTRRNYSNPSALLAWLFLW